jgi:hypothetical protein
MESDSFGNVLNDPAITLRNTPLLVGGPPRYMSMGTWISDPDVFMASLPLATSAGSGPAWPYNGPDWILVIGVALESHLFTGGIYACVGRLSIVDLR